MYPPPLSFSNQANEPAYQRTSEESCDPMILNLTYAKVFVFFLYFLHKNYLECPQKV